MTVQYLRKLSLVVAKASGEGIELGDFHVTFAVRRGDFQTPNSCDVRVFNLGPQTANALAKTEYSQLALSAGYQGLTPPGPPPTQIFQGTIKQYRQGRLNQLDSYVDITAADGDEAYNFAPIFVSVPANNPQQTIQDTLLKAMKPFGVVGGYSPVLPPNKLVRGRVLYGLCRDEYRDFAWTNNCKWSIQDGRSTLVPYTSYVPSNTPIPIISVSSGLIGVPEQTQRGVEIRTLLNPAVKIGQLIQLTGGVNTFRRSLNAQEAGATETQAALTQTSVDGLYYVMAVDHIGDTRGQDWYSVLTCLSVDSSLTSASPTLALTVAAAQNINRYGQ